MSASGLTIGSLFSGIGGLELGLERAGLGPVKWQVEIDPYCRAVLAKHWPDARRYEDVRSVGPELERVDIVCGGFPCQDISSVGLGAGLAGSRSGLWFEFKRIIGELRPRFAVVENVAALAGNGLDELLRGLAEVGMDAIWFPVAASDLGAPHQRERTFVVAYPASIGLQGRDTGRHNGEGKASRVCAELAGGRGGSVRGWNAEPGICGVVDGLPYRVDRVHALGNAVVPQVAEVVGWVVRGIAERIPDRSASVVNQAAKAEGGAE